MLIIELNNVSSNIIADSKDIRPLEKILLKNFRVTVPGAKYTYLYKAKKWDGLTNLWNKEFDCQNNQFTIRVWSGTIPKLLQLFGGTKINWRISSDKRNLPTNCRLQSTKVPLRPYQFNAAKAAFSSEVDRLGWFPRGVIEIPCGGGKTIVAVAMYEMNLVPTFFLVHRKDLLVQAKERFEEYGHKPGVIGDSKFSPQRNLNIATMQTLKRIFDEENSTRAVQLNKLVNNCQQIFLDECHIMASSLNKGNEFVEVANKFNAPFRWGLSATPFLKSSYDNMLLEGITGQLLYKISAAELIKLGYLTPPKVIMKHVPGTLPITMDWSRSNSNKSRTEYWRKTEEKGIKFNEIRTNLILDEIENGKPPLLILVKTVDQARFINHLWVSRGHEKLLFLSGKDKVKDRQKAIQQLKNGKLKTLMVTTIFDEGIDLPNLKTVILASGGRSEVKSIQRIGRALRPSSGKKKCIIIDFQDGHNSLLKKHAGTRRKTYEEQGFDVVVENEKT